MSPAEAKHPVRIVALLAVIVAAAAAFRLVGLGRLAVDQYDEGAYAMSAQAVADGTWPEGAYPTQHYLSPPLLFGAAGLLGRMGIDVERALIGFTAVCGVLSSLAAFVVVRGLVGPREGLAAAAFVAFSDYHVVYSRTGMTDVPFALFFLLAVGAFSVARNRHRLGWWLLAGLCTGLAWNTKYHGWLAGVIAASALVVDVVAPPPGRARKEILARFAVAVACACYAPWALHVMGEPGGYAKLMAEHRQFLDPARWMTQGAAQIRKQIYLDGWLSRAAPAVALLAAAWAGGRLRPAVAAAAAGLAALACAVTGAAVAVALALVGVAVVLADRTRRAWQLAAWAACFTILTPLYHHYPRLALPFMLASWCLAGAGIERLATVAARRPWAGWLTGSLGLVAAAAVLAAGLRPDLAAERTRAVATWHGKRGSPRVAEKLAPHLPAGAVVDVVGDPPLVFHLRRRGVKARHRDELEHLKRREEGRRDWVIMSRWGRKTHFEPLRRKKHLSIEKRATAYFSVGEVRHLNDLPIEVALEHRARGERGHEVDLYAVESR